MTSFAPNTRFYPKIESFLELTNQLSIKLPEANVYIAKIKPKLNF